MLKNYKREETPGGKLLRTTARHLLDMQFEAEVGSWAGGTAAEEMRHLSSDASFVIMEIGIEYAAHVASKRPPRFDVRDIHRKMHAEVQKVVFDLSTKLEDLELASYPGGPEKARVDEVTRRIATCSQYPNDVFLEYLRETVVRGNKLLLKLSTPTKNKLAGLVFMLQSREHGAKAASC